MKDINKKQKLKVQVKKEENKGSGRPKIHRTSSNTYSLKTSDIDGAQSRTRVGYYPFGFKRSQYRNTNSTEDIPGAMANMKAKMVRPYSAPTDRTYVPKARQMIESRVRESIQRQYLDMQQAFKQFDRDGSGKLTPEEFSKVMNDCQINLKNEEANVVLKGFDTNNSGFLDYERFLSTIGPVYTSKPSNQDGADVPAEANVNNNPVSLQINVGEGTETDSKEKEQKEPNNAENETENKSTSEFKWKPSKNCIPKADRPQTSRPSSMKSKLTPKQSKIRPYSSPARRSMTSSVRFQPQQQAASMERPKSAFPLRCRHNVWENTQLKEDIATIRALR